MIEGIDHVAITVSDIEASTHFYCERLGGRVLFEHLQEGSLAVRVVKIGGAVVNIHQFNNGVIPVADRPTPGSTDICFAWASDIGSAIAFLERQAIPILLGPVDRRTAHEEKGLSVYFRDPDQNLLEIMARAQGGIGP